MVSRPSLSETTFSRELRNRRQTSMVVLILIASSPMRSLTSLPLSTAPSTAPVKIAIMIWRRRPPPTMPI